MQVVLPDDFNADTEAAWQAVTVQLVACINERLAENHDTGQ